MTRVLLIGLVVVGVVVGVGVSADTPQEPETERQKHKTAYLKAAEQVAEEWSHERLEQETRRLTFELIKFNQERAGQKDVLQETPEAEENRGSLGEVTVEVLPGNVLDLSGPKEHIHRAMEIIRELERAAQVGRFQIVTLEKGRGGSMFLVLDTTTGEVWGGDGRPNLDPYKVMTSVVEKQTQVE